MDKRAVFSTLRATLQSELDAVLRVAEMAVDEATHAETRAENKYDTRGLEASYLAAGQARRLADLRQGLATFDSLAVEATGGRVQVGALVQVEEEEGSWWCFLTPGGGGSSVEVEGVLIRFISPRSPIGLALLGAHVDDEVSWSTPQGVRRAAVVRIE
jgi:transcription elongation GreA/GreB family factor